MSATVLYSEPAVLDREEHKSLQFTDVQDYSFTQGLNSVPLVGIEFLKASRHLPILFIQDDNEAFLPIALLSLDQDGNTQVNAEGLWRGGYVPAFIRRYPFALTENGRIFFDTKAPHFEGDKGCQLFKENGENTEELEAIIQFLGGYDLEQEQTLKYCQALKEKDLLVPQKLHMKFDEKPGLSLEGFYIIDEVRLSQLDKADITEWFRSNWLFWSYAHLSSLGSFDGLKPKVDKG